jgi:hypothetical protein
VKVPGYPGAAWSPGIAEWVERGASPAPVRRADFHHLTDRHHMSWHSASGSTRK